MYCLIGNVILQIFSDMNLKIGKSKFNSLNISEIKLECIHNVLKYFLTYIGCPVTPGKNVCGGGSEKIVRNYTYIEKHSDKD